jgi:hypothetical protein
LVSVEILLEVFLVGYPLYLWSRPVRTARFYDSSFVVSGKNPTREIAVSDIQSVSLVSGSILINIERVSISLTGEEKPLEFFGNPRNRRLGLNLYSWLTQQVKNVGTT